MSLGLHRNCIIHNLPTLSSIFPPSSVGISHPISTVVAAAAGHSTAVSIVIRLWALRLFPQSVPTTLGSLSTRSSRPTDEPNLSETVREASRAIRVHPHLPESLINIHPLDRIRVPTPDLIFNPKARFRIASKTLPILNPGTFSHSTRAPLPVNT